MSTQPETETLPLTNETVPLTDESLSLADGSVSLTETDELIVSEQSPLEPIVNEPSSKDDTTPPNTKQIDVENVENTGHASEDNNENSETVNDNDTSCDVDDKTYASPVNTIVDANTTNRKLQIIETVENPLFIKTTINNINEDESYDYDDGVETGNSSSEHSENDEVSNSVNNGKRRLGFKPKEIQNQWSPSFAKAHEAEPKFPENLESLISENNKEDENNKSSENSENDKNSEDIEESEESEERESSDSADSFEFTKSTRSIRLRDHISPAFVAIAVCTLAILVVYWGINTYVLK